MAQLGCCLRTVDGRVVEERANRGGRERIGVEEGATDLLFERGQLPREIAGQGHDRAQAPVEGSRQRAQMQVKHST